MDKAISQRICSMPTRSDRRHTVYEWKKDHQQLSSISQPPSLSSPSQQQLQQHQQTLSHYPVFSRHVQRHMNLVETRQSNQSF